MSNNGKIRVHVTVEVRNDFNDEITTELRDMIDDFFFNAEEEAWHAGLRQDKSNPSGSTREMKLLFIETGDE